MRSTHERDLSEVRLFSDEQTCDLLKLWLIQLWELCGRLPDSRNLPGRYRYKFPDRIGRCLWQILDRLVV